MKLLTLGVLLAMTPIAFAQNLRGPEEQGLAIGDALGNGPWMFATSEPDVRIRVSVVTKGLSRPWGMAWLPNGDILVTERAGTLRIVRSGVLQPEPIAGVPQVHTGGTSGLLDVAVHPQFSTNRFVYLSYNTTKLGQPQPGRGGQPRTPRLFTTALARGRFDGKALIDVNVIFHAEPWVERSGGDASRLLFAPDGTLFMSSSHHGDAVGPQNPLDDLGKILRLNDDGTIPRDNPFVGRPSHRPEIYSLGHRTVLGLALHPTTGELWETENGPQGGDEVNVIQPGKNYGWPLVTYGHHYDGTPLFRREIPAGMEPPKIFWVPSITTSGLVFLNSDRIPKWKGNLFVGSMTVGRVGGTGHLERIVFNAKGEQLRETLLADLRQRIRDVRQGPDGLLYVLTDQRAGSLLQISPAP